MADKTGQQQGEGAGTFKNRIIGYGTKPADQFQAHPDNWRRHPQEQRDAMRAALTELGWIGVVVENVRTGYLVDGHERVWEALQNGNAEVPFVQVDISEEEEAYALATFDPIGQMAIADKEALDAVLRQVQTESAAIQQLVAQTAERAELYLEQPQDTPPEDFASYDEQIETQYCCPKCGYKWSGKPE